MSLLIEAIDLAVDAHATQVDKAGLPYIHHPLAVMEIVRLLGGDEVQQAVAVLHDVVEDTKETFETVAAWLGCELRSLERATPGKLSDGAATVLAIIEGLRLMTKADGAQNDPYIEALAVSPFRLVKYADSLHNYVRLEFLPMPEFEADVKRLSIRYSKNFDMLGETFEEKVFRTHYSMMLRAARLEVAVA